MIIANQRTALHRMPLKLRKNRGRVRASFDIFERIIPSTCPRACIPIQDCDIRAIHIHPSDGGRTGKWEVTINPARRINIPNRDPVERVESARARTELFSRAPNRTLICDSDCHKLKGMPTFSLSFSLLHDLLDLINARCIARCGTCATCSVQRETRSFSRANDDYGKDPWERACHCADLCRYNWNYIRSKVIFL